MNILARITKIDAAKREVHGVMAEEAPDKSGEIFDYATSKPYVKEWSDDAALQTALAGQEISYGNVRSQHNPKIAAGKLTSIDFDDADKKILVVARIVDNGEWAKVQEGVYTGFSIGGQYVKRWADGRNIRYTARPTEVSIVDAPCMTGATFSMVKANGAVETRQFRTTDAGAQIAEQIAEIRKLFDGKADVNLSPRFRPYDGWNCPPEKGPTPVEMILKSLAKPLRGYELEKQQSQSGRFVPRDSTGNKSV
jgi:hypothetical protein